MDKKKRILICPLDWGLGHAARCIPLIKELSGLGHTVLIAASGYPLALLKAEFPEAETIDFPGYHISYPGRGNMAFHVLLNFPGILCRISREHREIKKLVSNYHIDLVISDNRFGLSHKSARCIYITHQVMIRCPKGLKFLEPLLYKIHGRYIRKYDECWIPDLPGKENISGDLSHKYPLPENARFIGWLSRFSHIEELSENTEKSPDYDVLAILSGPEPQRSIFENILIRSLAGSDLKSCILRGTPGRAYSSLVPPGIDIFPHASTEEFYSLVRRSKTIICRPGYTTLMDLAALNSKAILVPTPGQTEQEYLAGHLAGKGLFYQCSQSEFDLKKTIMAAREFNGFTTHGQRHFFFPLPDHSISEMIHI